jgi:hypothetical protein
MKTPATGLIVNDHDFSGTTVAMHYSGHDDIWTYGTAYQQLTSQGYYQQSACVCNDYAAAFEPIYDVNGQRSDGYAIWGQIFQGPGVYDQNVQQWSVPDGYGGTVDDPMSQRAYTWNRNNPIAYSDPSGFDPGGGSYAVYTGGDPVAGAELQIQADTQILNAIWPYALMAAAFALHMGPSGESASTAIAAPELVSEDSATAEAESSGFLFRGVSAEHPAIEQAREGEVVPGDINGTITEAEHNIGGREYLPGVLLRRGVETSIWHATTRIARVRAV